MPQGWFEMAKVRRRKFASSAWIPLRAVQPICEEGKRGHPGFKEEFFGAGSLAVPVDLKEKAAKLGCSDVGISHEQRACVDDGRYIPSDMYEYSRGEHTGFSLVLERRRATRLALVGTFEVRLADAHLPGSELAEAIKLARIDSSSPALHQRQTLIANCASAATAIATLLERLAESENDKGEKNG